MVESTALEMRRGWKPTVGSNPTLSAIPLRALGFAGRILNAHSKQDAPLGRSMAGERAADLRMDRGFVGHQRGLAGSGLDHDRAGPSEKRNAPR